MAKIYSPNGNALAKMFQVLTLLGTVERMAIVDTKSKRRLQSEGLFET